MLDYSKCFYNRIPLECNYMVTELIFCENKRNPMRNYSEFTEFTYPPPFKDGYQVEKHNNNTDRNDYDKPKKAD